MTSAGDSSEQGPPSPTPEFAFSPPAAAAGQAGSDTPIAQPTSSQGSGLRSSLSPEESRALKAAVRRQTAAEWITAQTGIAVPYDTDVTFRHSLRDGVALCRLVNALCPGTISKVIDTRVDCSSPTGEVIQSFENVGNFIAAVKELVGESSLCAGDLEDFGERPQVADCILALHAWWQQQQQPPPVHPLRSSGSWGGVTAAAAAAAAAAARCTPPPSLRPPASPASSSGSPCSSSEFSFTPHAAAAVNRAAGQQKQDGLEYLMRTCNHMLKNTMGLPATPLPPPPRSTNGLPPEIALDAVGPVLETVLQSLTVEYEKRLLAKDQEFKLGQEAQQRMRREIAQLKQEVADWKEKAAAVKYLPAPTELTAEEKKKFEEQLRATQAEAQAKVAEKEAALRRAQEEAAAAAAAAEQHVAEADAKLDELSHEVLTYRGLNERYRQIAEENRQLYNTVQDLRGNIRVFCRVRPRGLTGDNSASMVELGEEGNVNVFSNKHNKWHTFKFDRAFGEDSTQNDVYAETQPLIRSVLDGYNVCIFAYGQTGSGKTHTMSGTDIGEYANRGLNYRALDDLFDLNRQRNAEVEYNIAVQLLEIYNESIRDLLVSDAEARQQRSLQLVNTQRSGSNVPDAIRVPVACTEDVLDLMERGARNRAVAETKMNDRSSRSHQVLTVIVEGTNKITHARSHGCLHLIDLAGSERVGKSGAEGQQLLEAQHINKSLSALGSVMHALASKNAHVPFRDSKLTQLLQDSLSGQAKTMMFMHIAPEMTSVSETLSTLNFGKGVTEITLGAAKKNAESGAVFEAKERAMKTERALAAERERSAQLQAAFEAQQAELEALRAQLARAASSPCVSSEDEGTIPAYRPAATRRAPTAAAAQGAGSGGGLTPRSRLSLPPVPAAAGGRMTPRDSTGGSRGLTPRSGMSAGGGTTPRSGPVSSRPPQVSRLNLGGSGSKLGGSGADDKRLSGGSGVASLRPAMAKLNLQKLNLQRSETEENRTPQSARGSSSRIPVPSPSPPSAALGQRPSGSLTARPSLRGKSAAAAGPSSSRIPLSARESPAQAAARRATLQQKAAGGPATGSATARGTLGISASMRRTTSGSSDISSNGSLNSARSSLRSGQVGVTGSRRWA